jgi:hypothetical protein
MQMRTVILVTTLAICVLGVTKAVAQPLVPGDIDLRKRMNPSEFSQAGLHKLDPEELSALNSWINQFFFDLLAAADRPRQPAPYTAESRRTYPVELSHDGERFVINGVKYKAKTYCLNVHEGDRVIFTEGSAFGGCASAEFLNLRTNKKCSVWCE